MMRWLILCNNCVEDIDNIGMVFDAKFGDQGIDDEDGAILACQDWNLPHWGDSLKFFCDECGKAVAVAPSSQWFIENHRNERDKENA